MEKFNREHPGFNVQIPNAKSKCIINTVRGILENEDGIVIRNDRSQLVTNKGNIPMPDSIEIECSSRDRIKTVKHQLIAFLDFLGLEQKAVTTKKTREEQAMELMERIEKTSGR